MEGYMIHQNLMEEAEQPGSLIDEAEQPESPMDEAEKSGSPTPTPEAAPIPDEGMGAGYLDEVLKIFDWHKHPFIMVEECAMTWMGATVPVGRQVCHNA